MPKWHEINTSKIIVSDNGDSLINLSAYSNSRIFFEPKYYNRKIPGSIKECYIRSEVYERLNNALRFLPAGYGFKIFDAWRPFEVQKYLYDEQVSRLISEKNVSGDIACVNAKRFVSFPSSDPKKPFVHSTGGAVDLTIIDNHNFELDMGTDFDCFSVSAAIDAFEGSQKFEIRNNRRMLYGAMTSAGFSNYPSEWWHYDYGDSFWAAECNLSISLYGGIYKL